MIERLFALAGVFVGLLGPGGAANAADLCEAPIIPSQRMAAVVSKWLDQTSYREPTAALLRYTFISADGPPTVEILFTAGGDRLAEVMAEEAKYLRAPCVAAAGQVRAHQFNRQHVYSRGEVLTKPERRLQEDVGLMDLIRIVKGVKSQKVRFDFREMGCPFTLEFAPFQPYAPNEVLQSGDRVPARVPFLDWMRSLPLDFPKEMMGTAMGQRSRVHVPCAVLDLS
jgi:hypothetical protein